VTVLFQLRVYLRVILTHFEAKRVSRCARARTFQNEIGMHIYEDERLPAAVGNNFIDDDDDDVRESVERNG